jgi:hypothetical protein
VKDGGVSGVARRRSGRRQADREDDAHALGVARRRERSRAAKIMAVISLCAWIAVIICGRLLTFYRPGDCGPQGPGIIAECIPGAKRS